MSTAIFGGTFDPVHAGHVAMVAAAIKEFNLSRLVVVPNGNPPHKTDFGITDFKHRYNMVSLAFDGMEGVEISDYEDSDDHLKYSLYTMRHFRKLYGEDTFFIIGADSLLTLHKWHEYKTFLKENHLIVFHREGDETFEDTIDKYKREYHADIRVSSMGYVDISSTYIRGAIKQNSLPEGIVPCSVMSYIKKEGLYLV